VCSCVICNEFALMWHSGRITFFDLNLMIYNNAYTHTYSDTKSNALLSINITVITICKNNNTLKCWIVKNGYITINMIIIIN